MEGTGRAAEQHAGQQRWNGWQSCLPCLPAVHWGNQLGKYRLPAHQTNPLDNLSAGTRFCIPTNPNQPALTAGGLGSIPLLHSPVGQRLGGVGSFVGCCQVSLELGNLFQSIFQLAHQVLLKAVHLGAGLRQLRPARREAGRCGGGGGGSHGILAAVWRGRCITMNTCKMLD